ncbi:hypothetical protein [Rhodoflexus sp.]
MENEIYVLPEKTPSKNVALSYLLGGVVLAVIGWLIGGMAMLALGAVGLVGIGIGAVQYFSKPVQTILLSEERLALQSAGKTQEIPLAAIDKAELVQLADGKVQKIPLQQLQSFTANEKAILSIADTKGQRIEIQAAKFGLSDFESLVYVLQTQLSDVAMLPDASQYDALIAENKQYIRQDEQLKESLTKSLIDSLKALYVPRGELYMKEHPDAAVVFKHQPNPNDGATYFLENDYQQGLTPEAIEQGKNLLLKAHTNLETVAQRIQAYRQIADKLAGMKQELLAQRKLAQAGAELQSLEAKNQRGNEAQGNHELQIATFHQLKQLTADLHSIRDFGDTAILAEVDKILKG